MGVWVLGAHDEWRRPKGEDDGERVVEGGVEGGTIRTVRTLGLQLVRDTRGACEVNCNWKKGEAASSGLPMLRKPKLRFAQDKLDWLHTAFAPYSLVRGAGHGFGLHSAKERVGNRRVANDLVVPAELRWNWRFQKCDLARSPSVKAEFGIFRSLVFPFDLTVLSVPDSKPLTFETYRVVSSVLSDERTASSFSLDTLLVIGLIQCVYVVETLLSLPILT